MMRLSLNQQRMASHNRAAVLTVIRQTGAISRAEIAGRLRLVRSAVTKIARELLAAGIVHETPLRNGKRDEPRSRLSLNADWGRVLTVNLSNSLSLGVVNLAGELLQYERLAGDRLTPGHYRDRFEELLKPALSRLIARHASANLMGIGVLSIGHVDAKGIIRENSQLPRGDVDMRRVLEDVTDLPIHTDHEIRLLLEWRTWQEDAREWGIVVALNPRAMGTAGGHALMFDGRVFRGRDGMAGLNDDHIPVPYGGEAGIEMLRQVRDWGGMAAYLEQVKAGENQALDLYHKIVANCGVRLAHVVNTYNPDVVLLFGPYVDLGDRFLEDITQAARDAAEPLCLERVALRFAGKREDREGLAAAAIPVLSRVFVEGVLERETRSGPAGEVDSMIC